MPCGPIGLLIAGLAILRSYLALAELRTGKRAASARMMMKISMGMGVIGLLLSILLMVLAIVLRVTDVRR